VGVIDRRRAAFLDWRLYKKESFAFEGFEPIREAGRGWVDEDWALFLGGRSQYETVGHHASLYVVRASASTYSCDATLVHIDARRYLHCRRALGHSKREGGEAVRPTDHGGGTPGRFAKHGQTLRRRVAVHIVLGLRNDGEFDGGTGAHLRFPAHTLNGFCLS